MLPAILNTPDSRPDWDTWSFHLREEVDRVQTAIRSTLGITLPDQQLYPIPWQARPVWLQRVQQAFTNFTSVLDQQSSDVQDVNLDDENQKRAWIAIVWQQLSDAETTLRI